MRRPYDTANILSGKTKSWQHLHVVKAGSSAKQIGG
jgi:hypothetical protein